MIYPLCGGHQWSSSGPLLSQQCSPLLWFQRTRDTHNLYCMNSALLCIAVHPKRFTIMWGSLFSHHQCTASTWLMRRLPQDNSASALTTHQLQVERRESHWCKWMGIIRRSWLTRASSGNLARTPGLHPYSFTRSAMGFLTTTESQDLGLMSHPKDRWSSERLMDGHLLKLKCKYSNILRYWILDFHEL